MHTITDISPVHNFTSIKMATHSRPVSKQMTAKIIPDKFITKSISLRLIKFTVSTSYSFF